MGNEVSNEMKQTNNKEKNRETWVGYYTRVTKDKTKYTRKQKHKNKNDY